MSADDLNLNPSSSTTTERDDGNNPQSLDITCSQDHPTPPTSASPASAAANLTATAADSNATDVFVLVNVNDALPVPGDDEPIATQTLTDHSEPPPPQQILHLDNAAHLPLHNGDLNFNVVDSVGDGDDIHDSPIADGDTPSLQRDAVPLPNNTTDDDRGKEAATAPVQPESASNVPESDLCQLQEEQHKPEQQPKDTALGIVECQLEPQLVQRAIVSEQNDLECPSIGDGDGEIQESHITIMDMKPGMGTQSDWNQCGNAHCRVVGESESKYAKENQNPQVSVRNSLDLNQGKKPLDSSYEVPEVPNEEVPAAADEVAAHEASAEANEGVPAAAGANEEVSADKGEAEEVPADEGEAAAEANEEVPADEGESEEVSADEGEAAAIEVLPAAAEANEEGPADEGEAAANEEVPADEGEADEEVPANEVEANKEVPAFEGEVNEESPAAEGEAKANEEVPADEGEDNQEVPADEGEANEEVPADEGEVEANEEVHADEGEATKEVPADEGEANKEVPADEGEANKEVPADEGEANEEIPEIPADEGEVEVGQANETSSEVTQASPMSNVVVRSNSGIHASCPLDDPKWQEECITTQTEFQIRDSNVGSDFIDCKSSKREVEQSLVAPDTTPCCTDPGPGPELSASSIETCAESKTETGPGPDLSMVASTETCVETCAESKTGTGPGYIAFIPPVEMSARSKAEVKSTSSMASKIFNGCEDKNDEEASLGGEQKTEESLLPSMGGSINNASFDRQNANAEVNANTELAKRPFYYMIRIPRLDDENLKDQVKKAQFQVDEKTETRDAIRHEYQMTKAKCKEYDSKLNSLKLEERTARELLKAKRKEIDALQSVINRVKSALSVGDIDGRIHNMEHMIQHETLPLKEEKQFIREIKQLKQLREQLSSDVGSEDEVQQAMDQKEEVEDRLKILRKEVESLRDNVSKAEAATIDAKKLSDDEKQKHQILLTKFKAADGIRQEAYTHLLSLKKQLYDKNKIFWKYRDQSKLANDLALKGDKEELQRLCADQVEAVMELWNQNDEFRNEYVRSNMRSTVRRLRTLDGRSLGPDEEPPFLPNRVAEGETKSNTGLHINASEAEKPAKVVEMEKSQETDSKSQVKVGNQKNQTAKTKKQAKSATLQEGVATFSGRIDIEEARQEEERQSKEEEELARKIEELRKEKEAALLKEQRLLEEKAKAKEAMERKKRNAEKALARAVLRAQKEAEQKEKEREKRVRKKEKKKAYVAGDEGDSAVGAEAPVETTEPEPEAREKPVAVTVTKRPQRPSQFTKVKPMPLPLRNRGKRRTQTWMWALVTALIILALFVVGNSSFVFGLGLQRFGL